MRLPRRLIIPAAALAALAVILLLGIALRTQLAESIIGWQLAARGVAGDLKVQRLGLHDVELRDVAIAHLRVERAYLRFSPWDLRRGVFEEAVIEGVAITLDLTGKGPILGDLQKLLPEPGGETAWTQLPRLTLRRARITMLLPRGPLPIDASATVVRRGGDGAAASLAFSGASQRLSASGAARAQFEGLVPVSADVTADLRHRREDLTVSLRAETETLRAERPDTRFTLTGEGMLTTLATELPWPDAWRPEAGRFRVGLEGHAVFPLTENPLDDLRVETALNLALQDVTDVQRAWLDDIAGTVEGRLSYGARVVQGNVSGDIGNPRTGIRGTVAAARLDLADDYSVTAVSLAGIDAHARGIDTPFGRFAQIDLSGALAGPPAAPAGGLTVRATAPSLILSGSDARRVVLDAVFTVASADDGFQLVLTQPGRVSVGELRLPAILPLRGLNARIRSASLDLTPYDAGLAFDHRAIFELPQLPIRVARKDAGPLPVDIRLRPVTLRIAMPAQAAARLELDTVVESLNAPEARMQLSQSRLTLQGDPLGLLEADLVGGRLAQQIEQPLFAALTPRLHGTRRGNTLVLQGSLRGAGDDIAIAATGGHDLATGRGRLHLDVQEIVFGRGGTEGEAISPVLRPMQALRGRARGEAEVTWDAAGLDSRGILALQDLSFTRGGIAVDDADLTLTLDHLVPLHSLPRQRLTVRRIGAGVDLTNLELTFQLETADGGVPRLAAERLSLQTLGGRVTASGGSIEPSTGNATLSLMASDFNLATLVQQLGFEDLRAEGRITGEIPVRIVDGAVVITDAHMQAEGPGRIQFRSPDTRQALASGGQAVSLMLDALEDFQYDTLRMGIDKPAQGDSRIVIRLNGRNPAVLEGQPFNFNINLTGNADPLLAALAEGQRLRNQALQPLFRLQQVP